MFSAQIRSLTLKYFILSPISKSCCSHQCTDLTEGLSFWAAQEQIQNGGTALSFTGGTNGVCGAKCYDSSDASTFSSVV